MPDAPPPQDPRPWVKVSVDYFDNPKIDALSDMGQLLHLMLIVKSGQRRTDGVVTKRLATSRGDKPFRELLNAGLLRGHEDGYQIHDYEKHQTPATTVKAHTEKRKAAGTVGGRKSNHVRNHERKGKRVHGCEFCYPDGPPVQSDGPAPF